MKQNPDFTSHSERRQIRIKMAQHVLNMRALEQEMKRYNVHALQKSAAVGANREQRIKYAALLRQYELEKQAFLGRLAGMAGKGLWNAGKGMFGAAKGVGNMAGRAAQAAPRATAMGAGAAGAAGGMAAPSIAQGAQNAGNQASNWAQNTYNSAAQGLQNTANSAMQGVQNTYNSATQPMRNIGDAIGTGYGNTMNFFGNLRRAGGDIMRNLNQGMTQAGRRF